MRKLLIDDEPYLLDDIILTPDEIIGLRPGDKVTEIGTGAGVKTGRVTSSARLDKFNPFIEYAGTMLIDNKKCLAFKLPDGGVLDAEGLPISYAVYKLYFITDDHSELIVPTFQSQGIRIFRPCYKRYQEPPCELPLGKGGVYEFDLY